MMEYENPNWNEYNKVHDWKNYVSEDLKREWPFFSRNQRRLIAENAQTIADQEIWD